jgi:hypothetical protein
MSTLIDWENPLIHIRPLSLSLLWSELGRLNLVRMWSWDGRGGGAFFFGAASTDRVKPDGHMGFYKSYD